MVVVLAGPQQQLQDGVFVCCPLKHRGVHYFWGTECAALAACRSINGGCLCPTYKPSHCTVACILWHLLFLDVWSMCAADGGSQTAGAVLAGGLPMAASVAHAVCMCMMFLVNEHVQCTSKGDVLSRSTCDLSFLASEECCCTAWRCEPRPCSGRHTGACAFWRRLTRRFCVVRPMFLGATSR
jgi:hypothetical protein